MIESPDDPLESWVREHVALLSGRGPRISLDELGEVVGAAAVTPIHIERLIDALEAEGFQVGDEGREVSVLLRQVLVAARVLKAEGRAPSPRNIAERSGLSLREVRVALLFADVLKS